MTFELFFLNDSTVVLSRIQRNEVSVGNLASEILNLSNLNNCRYAPGQLNPANLPFIGCSP